MTQFKPTHGGARKGAGRRASGKASANLTVRLPVATKARIKALAAKAGVSASEIVRRKFAGNAKDLAPPP